MITTIALASTSISLQTLLFCVRIFKPYLLCNIYVYDSVLLAVITMLLYIGAPEFVHLVTRSL